MLLPLSAKAFLNRVRPWTALILICFGLFTVPALATSLTDFNLIALGDLKGTSEVEGRVIVFGDIYGSTKNFATRSEALSPPMDTPGLNQTDGLIVGGQIRDSSIQVNNGGVRVGGSDTGVQVNNASYRIYNDSTVADLMTGITLDIKSTVSMLDGLTTNSYVNLDDMNRAVFDSTSGEDNIAVFDIDASVLNRNGTLDLTGNLGADLIVIRVDSDEVFTTGSALDTKANAFGQDDIQAKIIWYMPDATDLTILNGLGGAVIAPNADLTLGNPIEGTVVAKTITLNAEIHLPSLASPALDPPPITPVPEPSPALLLGLGLLSLVVLVRRLIPFP